MASSLTEGSVITFRRVNDANGVMAFNAYQDGNQFALNQIRAYEIPNLLQAIGATPINPPDTISSEQNHRITNLLKNFDIRSSHSTIAAIKDYSDGS